LKVSCYPIKVKSKEIFAQQVSCYSIKVKSKEIFAQFYVFDIGYALLFQSNIMSFGGGEINLDISSNTLGMITLYELTLIRIWGKPTLKRIWGITIMFCFV
jgi:hypothetical protein